MKKASSEEKVSIKVAAKAMGVSKGTIVHYLNNGKLSRIKEGSTVYISTVEINRLLEAREDSAVITPKAKIPESKHVVVTKVKSSEGDGTTVTVDRNHYEEILTRVGRLELENRNLRVYKDSMVKIKSVLNDREKELQEVTAKLHMMEEELRRLKKMSWWNRAFGRKWRMIGG
jgi:DNA-binding transcriptional MerR regulator